MFSQCRAKTIRLSTIKSRSRTGVKQGRSANSLPVVTASQQDLIISATLSISTLLPRSQHDRLNSMHTAYCAPKMIDRKHKPTEGLCAECRERAADIARSKIMDNLVLQCGCGQIKGRAIKINPADRTRVICYCKDCQALAILCLLGCQ